MESAQESRENHKKKGKQKKRGVDGKDRKVFLLQLCLAKQEAPCDKGTRLHSSMSNSERLIARHMNAD